MTPFLGGPTFVPQIWEYGNFSTRKLIFTLKHKKAALAENYLFLNFFIKKVKVR